MIKQLLLMILASLSFSAKAVELMQFAEVALAIKQGKSLTFVMNFKECEAHTPLGDSISSIKPDAFMISSNDKLTASYQHLTLNDPMYSDQPIMSYGKYDVYADGHVTVKITLMNAKDFTKLHELQVRCNLGQGFTIFD